MIIVVIIIVVIILMNRVVVRITILVIRLKVLLQPGNLDIYWRFVAAAWKSCPEARRLHANREVP